MKKKAPKKPQHPPIHMMLAALQRAEAKSEECRKNVAHFHRPLAEALAELNSTIGSANLLLQAGPDIQFVLQDAQAYNHPYMSFSCEGARQLRNWLTEVLDAVSA